jgi:hypothetical protein
MADAPKPSASRFTTREVLALRKELLQQRAAIEREELSLHVGAMRKPVSLLSTGQGIMKVWRGNTWVSTLAGLVVSRTVIGKHFSRAFRFAGYGYAAFKTYEFVQGFRRAAKRR